MPYPSKAATVLEAFIREKEQELAQYRKAKATIESIPNFDELYPLLSWTAVDGMLGKVLRKEP